MRNILMLTVLASLALGCSQPPQPEATPKVSIHVDENKASITVATPAAPQTPPPVATQESTPAPEEAQVTVKSGTHRVDISGKGVSADAGDGRRVDVSAQGVSADAGDGRRVDVSAKGVSAVDGAGGHVEVSAGGIQAGSTEKSGNAVHIQGAGQSKTLACKGEDVFVEGASNNIKITGKVGTLAVSGTSNQVEVENAARIEISGTSNKASWSGSKPEVSSSGLGNEVNEKK